MIKKYIKGKFLGKGGFAKCYEVSNMETKKISAIKIISKETIKKSKAKQKVKHFSMKASYGDKDPQVSTEQECGRI